MKNLTAPLYILLPLCSKNFSCTKLSWLLIQIKTYHLIKNTKHISLNHNRPIQIVGQSLLMKNPLILEELKWFNLVNGSGNLPSLAQVTFSYLKLSETLLIPFSGGCEEKVHEASKGKIIQGDKSCGSSGPPEAS